MKIQRVHFIESVYVGPTEPYEQVPPLEALENNARANEWTIAQGSDGVTITHRNPRAVTPAAPCGQSFTTFVGFANVRGIQYEPEAIVATKAKVAA